MSTITITPQPVETPDIEAPAVFPWPLYRMSLEQYDALVESGLFSERDRLQLINGILVTSCQNLGHTWNQRMAPATYATRISQWINRAGAGSCRADQSCRSAKTGSSFAAYREG